MRFLLLLQAGQGYKRAMPLPTTPLRIATRGSQLALWQAHAVKEAIMAANAGIAETDIELITIDSHGDIEQEQGFEKFGYKGIFTKRIEAALLDGRADIAVHSLKDLHSDMPDSLTLAAVLPREDPRDAFVSEAYSSIDQLPEGASVGTASVRRQAIINHYRPDLHCIELRGNVPTRLKKLAERQVDALILACAGLIRLGLETHIRQRLTPELMLPAAAQGAVGIQCRKDDSDVCAALTSISHAETMTCISAERALLHSIDGDCHSAISAHASLQQDALYLSAWWFTDEGRKLSVHCTGNAANPIALGQQAGYDLLKQVNAPS